MTLVEELQREIESWMSSRRNGNLSVLSRLSGVSYPTLRRIMQAEFTPNLKAVQYVFGQSKELECTQSRVDQENIQSLGGPAIETYDRCGFKFDIPTLD